MNVTIIGAGAYALALAIRFNKNNNKVVVFSKVKEEIDILNKTNMNEKALGKVLMPSNIAYTTDIKTALKKCEIVVIAVATKYLKDICFDIKPYVKNKHIVIASKGIDQDTNMFSSQIVRSILNTKRVCTISGPSFAKDMASDCLIGLSIASTNNLTYKLVSKALLNDNLKLRRTKDFIGVELCGTMKNVIAIIAGILDSLEASESTKAMFLTESLNDVKMLIKKLKGNEKTILSYAGFGDILLTCTSTNSRNYLFGKLVGKENNKDEIDNYLKTNTVEIDNYLKTNTVEGYYTLKSIYRLIKKKNISLPVINLIIDILENNKKKEDIFKFLK